YYWPIMFNRAMNDKLGFTVFWFFFIGFHLTFFIQHFLGLMGMPRRVFTYQADQGWDLFNFISSIGAILMAIGVLLLVLNMLLSIKSKPLNTRDYWKDGRSLEWAIKTPVPFYNFKQTPLVRGYDPYWIEKHEGNPEGMTYAEPLGDIHMPNNSILPLIMSIGLFVAAFGALYNPDADKPWSIYLLIIGLGITVLAMITRSFKDDLGYHVHKEDIIPYEEELYGKGGNK
ncbi:cytochrome ubiquinol oxidase subunit I, partial [Butyricicoccus sp. 1XD8-22]